MSNADSEARARVEALAAYGIPHKEIARLLRIDEEELATGRTRANSWVAEVPYQTAIAGGRGGATAAI